MAELADLPGFKKYEGRVVEVHFACGGAARVRLLEVDPDSPPHELLYQVLEVLAPGPPDRIALKVGASYASTPADVASWKVLG